MAKVRVRFAPSPTGDVHIGSIWLAHFDWLFARQHKGDFIVRLEDTDQKRLVAGSIEKVYEALDWYGLTPDEGPRQGGDYGPYVQSERLDIYRRYAQQLLKQGSAYYCFCSPQRLDELRAAQQAAKLPPRYDKRCVVIPPSEAKLRVKAGESAVIRLNVPASGSVTFDDLIRGKITFRYDQVDDSVLLKSDGWPTYHLAVVVDDHLMEISHVLRAEEWLSSTPKHLLVYQALNWAPPLFAHLPQILGPHKKKLSKREGAASALHFRDQGYLPEAMRNFLALMGWHPKGDSEILSPQDMLDQFILAEINPSGAVFDQTKLDWMNGWYIRHMRLPDLLVRLEPWWHIPADEQPDQAWRTTVVTIVRDRMKTLTQIDDLTLFLLPSVWTGEVTSFDRSILIPKKGSAEATTEHLSWVAAWLRSFHGTWSAPALKAALLADIASRGQKNNDVLWPVRVALSLRAASPDVFDMLAILGREESLRRLIFFRD